jgi:hypothetical protein
MHPRLRGFYVVLLEAFERSEGLAHHLVHVVVLVGREPAHESHVLGGVGQAF